MPALLVVTPTGAERDALVERLRAAGHVVQATDTGAEAVELALRMPPDVVLLDPALSAMDRWHAVKRLSTELPTRRIPVLTLASDAASPSGVARVLAKVDQVVGGVILERTGRTPLPAPASARPRVASEAPEPARAAVSRAPDSAPAAAVRMPPASSASVAPTSPPQSADPLDRGRILVVDDNALNRDMLSRRLARRGYEVEVAADGQQAIELIRAKRFDLVLLDWMMPGVSGIDVLRIVRERWSRAELPVIMATAKTEAEDLVEALRQEANDYVTKPINFDVVHARVRTQLALVAAHRRLAESEQRYRALLENTGDLIVQHRVDGRIEYVSPAVRTLLGHEPAEFAERVLWAWIHPVDRRALESQRSGGLPPAFTYIARMQRKDQQYLWVEVSNRVLRDQGGEPMVQAACRDVTEHMERLGGDEPPLPLGGDIMAHPGWRGSAEPPQRPVEGAPPVGGGGGPVVVVTVMPQGRGDDPERIAQDVAKRVSAALREHRG